MAIWASIFDNTRWQGWSGAPLGGASWDGSAWDSKISSGRDYVGLAAIGGWNVGSKDHITKIRVTWTQEDPKSDLWLYNTTATSFVQASPVRFFSQVFPNNVAEYNITFLGVDLGFLVLRNSSFEAEFKVTNIEFFGNFTPPSKIIKSLYQFSKGERSEIYTLAQYEVGCVREATNNPPAITTGGFGNGVFSSSYIGEPEDDQIPAHWSQLRDIMMYSNGIDQHQLFPGLNHKVGGFVVTNQFATLPRIPESGKDYTDKILENNTDFPTFSIDETPGNAFFVMTPVPANTLSWVFNAACTGLALVGDLHMRYVNTAGDFVEVTNFVDGTHDGSRPMSQDGDMTWDKPTNESATFMFGQSGYWYKFDFLGETGTDIINSTPRQVLYSGGWRSMENVWDGVLIDVIEAQLKRDGTPDVFETFAASTINISDMQISVDDLFFSCADKAYGLYINVGGTPNSASTTLLIDYWNGDGWINITIQDGTLGLTRSGFITWSKNHAAVRSQFNDSKSYTFWYRMRISVSDISENTIISALYLPVYNINEEFGEFGICNTAWKERACYTSSIFDRDIYVSASGRLNVLNGGDFAILEPGDGRRNRTVCIKKFHNEIIVWQEEKGRDGGCTTLFEGYNPSTFGKLVLSSQVGTFSAKSAIVIDGATTVTKKDDNYQTMAYFISHYGIFMTDGRVVTMVSQDIQNHFDTDFPNDCIRLGYEEEMWVEHDQDRGVLRFGLVTGDTAEYPNTFPVLDLEDGTWSFDTFEDPLHHLTHVCQIEAASGQFPIIHIGAAVDGFVYLLNEGLNDNGDAIDFHLQIELNNKGFMLDLREANIRMRSQTTGYLQKEIYENTRLITEETELISMVAEQVGDGMVRHRVFERIYEETHISLGFRENTVDQDVYLYDLNLDIGSVLNK